MREKPEPIDGNARHAVVMRATIELAAHLGLVNGAGVMGENDPDMMRAKVQEITETMIRVGGALEYYLSECQPCSVEEAEELVSAYLAEHLTVEAEFPDGTPVQRRH